MLTLHGKQMDLKATLSRRMISASKWSILSEATAKLITSLVFFILARLLGPDDFGVAAFAAMGTSFAQILWDSGLSKALIQSEDNPHDAANLGKSRSPNVFQREAHVEHKAVTPCSKMKTRLRNDKEFKIKK